MNTPAVKAAVRKRDGYRCTQCGLTNDEYKAVYRRSLDVHRVVPGSEYTIDGCVTLCRKCHRAKPRRAKGVRDLARKGQSIYVYVDPDVRAALDEFLQSREPRTTITGVLELAIKEYLTEKGKWPRKSGVA